MDHTPLMDGWMYLLKFTHSYAINSAAITPVLFGSTAGKFVGADVWPKATVASGASVI